MARYDRLHVLVNNAGMLFDKRIVTDEGLEKTFALNHMNYFYLTNLLLPMLKATGTTDQKARIINVASNLHRIGAFKFENIPHEKGYLGFLAYGQSKCMNIIHANELARRLSAEDAPVVANALHPGGVRTGFAGETQGMTRYVTRILRMLSFSPEQGAKTQIYLATSPEVEGVTGSYFVMSKPKKASTFARDPENGARLWAYSQQILTQLGL